MALAFGACDDDKPPASSGAGGGSGGQGNGGTGGIGGGTNGGQNVDCGPAEGAPAPLKLTQIASASCPVLVTSSWGDDTRIYIVEQNGRILVATNGGVPTPFLDLSAVVSGGCNQSERGLLGLAFHPDYAENGRFFVHYSDKNAPLRDSTIEEYRRSEGNPDQADPIPVGKILTEPDIDAAASNHNGGMIEFSPIDRFLYIGLGDGGYANDPEENGQNKNALYAKLLRIDVDTASPYAIPEGNITDGAPEVFDWGLRNAWRYSFDACTGDRYIGDVGQDAWEEVDIAPVSQGPTNWGWNNTEGNHCFDPGTGCDDSTFNATVEYPHAGQRSVTGGYVYRGSAIPWLRGAYVYGDFNTGQVWYLRWQNGSVTEGPTDISADLGAGSGIASFGQDNRGEIYLVSYIGSIFRIDPE